MTPCCDALFLHRGNRIDGELRCVGRGPHGHVAWVVRQVVQHLVGMGSGSNFGEKITTTCPQLHAE